MYVMDIERRVECQNSTRLDEARKFFGTIDFARRRYDLRNGGEREEEAFKWFVNGMAHRPIGHKLARARGSLSLGCCER